MAWPPTTHGDFRLEVPLVLGSAAAPISNAATARPVDGNGNGPACVIWLMAKGVTPTNATWVDIIINSPT